MATRPWPLSHFHRETYNVSVSGLGSTRHLTYQIHPANKDADPQGAAEHLIPACLAMDCVGTREGNAVLVALLSQPAQCLWLLFLISRPTQPGRSPLVSSSRAQHPLASLNTRRCCVGDLLSYGCYQNAKLLAPALRMSAERKPPCREPRRLLEDMLDFRAPSQVSQRQQLPTSALCLCPPFIIFPLSGCLAEWVGCFVLVWDTLAIVDMVHTPLLSDFNILGTGRSLTKLATQ